MWDSLSYILRIYIYTLIYIYVHIYISTKIFHHISMCKASTSQALVLNNYSNPEPSATKMAMDYAIVSKRLRPHQHRWNIELPPSHPIHSPWNVCCSSKIHENPTQIKTWFCSIKSVSSLLSFVSSIIYHYYHDDHYQNPCWCSYHYYRCCCNYHQYHSSLPSAANHQHIEYSDIYIIMQKS